MQVAPPVCVHDALFPCVWDIAGSARFCPSCKTRNTVLASYAESISAALQHMLSAEVVPRIAPAALHEPNGWRLEVLYADPRVNDVLVEHIETITVGCDSIFMRTTAVV